jgi:hypothetical protein
MDDFDATEIVGCRLARVVYYSVVGGAPMRWEEQRTVLLDYGLDLVFDEVTIGVGWLQHTDTAYLKLRRGSVADDLTAFDALDVARDDDWASLLGTPIRDMAMFRGCGPRDEVRAIELAFDAGPIDIAAATPLGGDHGELVFCSDDIMVGFGRENALYLAARSSDG